MAKMAFKPVLSLVRFYCRLSVSELNLFHSLFGIEGVLRLLLVCGPTYAPTVLRHFGATVGSENVIHTPLILHNADDGFDRLTIGNRCHVGKDVFFDLTDRVVIEDEVTVSMRTTILTHFDAGRSPVAQQGYPRHSAPVILRRGAYLGAGTTVLAGTTIGECAVVGAGAVVVADISAHSVAVGIPARVVERGQQPNAGG